MGRTYGKVISPADNSGGGGDDSESGENSSPNIIEPIIKPNNNWLIITDPDVREGRETAIQINSPELGFPTGEWIYNIAEGLIRAFYIALQFIQYPLVYRIQLPQDLTGYILSVRIGVEQRILKEIDGLPAIGDVSYQIEASRGIQNTATLVEIGFGMITVFNGDFGNKTFDLAGADYIDVYFNSTSEFIVATTQEQLGSFSHGFNTNIIGIQMARISTDASQKGDLKHITVSKVNPEQSLVL